MPLKKKKKANAGAASPKPGAASSIEAGTKTKKKRKSKLDGTVSAGGQAKGQSATPKPATSTVAQPLALERILASGGSVQQLEQLCGALGWGRRIAYQKGPGWVADVTCGLHDRVRAESGHHEPRTKKGEKAGRAAAATRAMALLRDRAAAALSVPAAPLVEAFPEGTDVEIVASDTAGWSRLRGALSAGKARARPRAVGVSTEGNDGSGAPLLVQVAAPDVVLVELPRSRQKGRISADLEKLLADDSVTKVFCDSAGHRDKRALGLNPPASSSGDSAGSASVVDLEAMASECFGPPAAHRGLSRIAGLTLGRRIAKGEDIDWASLENRVPPPRSLQEVPDAALRYAALEALGALKTWEVLHKSLLEHRDVVTTEESTRVDREVAADEEAEELGALDAEIAALEGQLSTLDAKPSKIKAKAAKKKSDAGSKASTANPAPAPRSSATAEATALAASKSSPVASARAPKSSAAASDGTSKSLATAPARRKAAADNVAAVDGGVGPAAPAPPAKKRRKVAAATAAAAAASTPQQWTGWRAALDIELQALGGSAPWRDLQEVLLRRRRRCECTASGGADVAESNWKLEALAAIPLHYLSTTDNVVKLPAAA